jgi:hypothetical protein
MMPRGIVADLAAMPAANAPARGNERQVAEHRLAWQREMERAQMDDWLAHGPLKTAAAQLAKPGARELAGMVRGHGAAGREVRADAPDQGQQAPHDRTVQLAKALGFFGNVQAATTVSGADHAEGCAVEPSTPADPADVHAIRTWGFAPPVLAGPDTRSAAHESAPPSVGVTRTREQGVDGRAAPSPPIRLHADWSSEGVRLWIGLDAGALEHMAPIAAHVRQWMRGQGVRVLSLACNGRPVTQAAGEPDRTAHAMTDTRPPLKPQETHSWPSTQ